VAGEQAPPPGRHRSGNAGHRASQVDEGSTQRAGRCDLGERGAGQGGSAERGRVGREVGARLDVAPALQRRRYVPGRRGAGDPVGDDARRNAGQRLAQLVQTASEPAQPDRTSRADAEHHIRGASTARVAPLR
jgi:hypothetical protein